MFYLHAYSVYAGLCVCEQIETLLQRNHSPRKFAADREYRLQQGCLSSSMQEVLNYVASLFNYPLFLLTQGSAVHSQWF